MFDQFLDAMSRGLVLFEKGGVLAYPLLLFSIIAGAVIIERWWTYRNSSGDDSWFRELLGLIERRDFAGASALLKGVGTPSGRVLEALVQKLSSPAPVGRSTLEKLANHHGRQEIRQLEKRLPVLSTIGNVSPLLGLMGTVLGMVKAFMKIESLQGQVNAAVLAGGIWEALLTTLFGLAVAIPALIAHSYLAARVRGIADEVQDHAVSFVDAVEDSLESGREGGS